MNEKTVRVSVGSRGRARDKMTADERRDRNRSYQDRFQARRRGEAVPPRGSSHAEPAYDVMTPADRDEERRQYLVAVRQHLDDVARGDIPPAGSGSGSTSRRRDRMHS